MAQAPQIETVPVERIRPYFANPRDNAESVPKVAASIREFGFLQPIVCDSDGVIICGHTRLRAALSLGLKTVPVLYARGLSEEQARAYRLADNKTGESSKWIDELLCAEIDAMGDSFDLSVFGFDTSPEEEARRAWERSEKLCELKHRITVRKKGDLMYTHFFATGKTGRPLEEIKEDPETVAPFASNLADWASSTLGGNIADGGWCLVTTPRRRHPEGTHFASAVCEAAAKTLGIPFHAGVITARTRERILPDFTLAGDIPEKNVILYDDIVTTGSTLTAARRLLADNGHVVLAVVSIKN